jgi:hypothetical protein
MLSNDQPCCLSIKGFVADSLESEVFDRFEVNGLELNAPAFERVSR